MVILKTLNLLSGRVVTCRLVHVYRDIFRLTGDHMDDCRPVMWPFSSLQVGTCPQGYLQAYRWPYVRLRPVM